MTSESETPISPAGRWSRRPMLWLGIGLAPAAWTLALLIGILIAGHGCLLRAPGDTRSDGLGLALVVVLGAFVLIAGRGWWAAIESSRGLGRDGTASSSPPLGRNRFLAEAGTIVSALVLFGVLLFLLPSFAPNGCNHVR